MTLSDDDKAVSEEILFRRYCDGDVKAFDTLLNRLKGLAYSFILRYVRNQSVADEIFQDVFLKICKNKDQFRESISFKSWMVTICKNTCIDHIRKQKRGFQTSSLDNLNDAHDRPLSERVASDAPTPDEELRFKIENAELTELMDQLPEEQRETFYLKTVMELTFEEIGAGMKCSTNTAKSRYRYALETLRALVKRKRLMSDIKAS
jgi:RNA polymerase sigma factor (sigma-70 family)